PLGYGTSPLAREDGARRAVQVARVGAKPADREAITGAVLSLRIEGIQTQVRSVIDIARAVRDDMTDRAQHGDDHRALRLRVGGRNGRRHLRRWSRVPDTIWYCNERY